jgi:hypothetical protein
MCASEHVRSGMRGQHRMFKEFNLQKVGSVAKILTNCGRCNKNLRLCDRGGQCGEACATNADCDPSSSCPGCKHGTCQP